MSREVRRVPVDWKHPVVFNEYWLSQESSPYGRSRPASRLHGPTERFVGLMGDYEESLDRWQGELADMQARQGHSWKFSVEYHLTGYKGREDDAPVVHPFYDWSEDGQSEVEVPIRDIDHLHELEVAKVEGERPNPNDYMPTFPDVDLGWCLYETVSEGTPVTPVFATASELIDHLATVGQDYDQEPMRRTSAEALVSAGHSMGSMVFAGGRLLKSDMDADLLSQGVQ